MPAGENKVLKTGGSFGRLLKKRVPECLALAAYMALLALVMSRHEPWFDEAEAWLMTRDLSLADLIFGWLRYEGHPPVWYLLLALPAKLGVPYEWGLKTVEWLCASAAAAVLLFRSPFPRAARLALPFTYFLFYQYGVNAKNANIGSSTSRAVNTRLRAAITAKNSAMTAAEPSISGHSSVSSPRYGIDGTSMNTASAGAVSTAFNVSVGLELAADSGLYWS